ncbi:MAG: late competence development ComFB family protein [Spirochaetota bacterium]
MAFSEEYDFSILRNEAERFVTLELGRRLEELSDPSICLCQDCILDMAALALNTIRPLYRVSLLGTMYASAMGEGEYQEEVRKVVDQAIAKVHASPSHD